MLAGGTVLGLLAAVLIVRSVAGPLQDVQAVVSSVANNFDYSRRVQVHGQDEVGRTAQALNHLLEAQQQAIQQVNDAVAHLANGQLSQRITADLRGDLGAMKQAINQSLQSVQTTMQGFNGLSAALAAGDFSYDMAYDQMQGEFRQSLSQAMQSMRAMERMIGNVGAVMTAVAQGDLSPPGDGPGNG